MNGENALKMYVFSANICFYCKGDIEPSTTTYMNDYQGCYIIKNVPWPNETR